MFNEIKHFENIKLAKIDEPFLSLKTHISPINKGLNRVLKRSYDIFFAIFFLFLSFPIFLIVAILIKDPVF